METIKKVPLSRGAFSLISIEDYARAMMHTWHLTSHGYAATKIKGESVYLHRFIQNTPIGFYTDHIDGNKLNNTRSNLRTATNAENGANSAKQRIKRSSLFKGVCLSLGRGKNPESGKKWIAYISKNGKRHHLGHFKTELDAALAYNLKAEEFFGDFALLNDLPLDFQNKVPEKFSDKKYSNYIGVSFNPHLKYWTSKIGNKTTYHKSEIDAAIDYNKRAIVIHGTNASLNQLETNK